MHRISIDFLEHSVNILYFHRDLAPRFRRGWLTPVAPAGPCRRSIVPRKTSSETLRFQAKCNANVADVRRLSADIMTAASYVAS
jgi:hypothetical protein